MAKYYAQKSFLHVASGRKARRGSQIDLSAAEAKALGGLVGKSAPPEARPTPHDAPAWYSTDHPDATDPALVDPLATGEPFNLDEDDGSSDVVESEPA